MRTIDATHIEMKDNKQDKKKELPGRILLAMLLFQLLLFPASWLVTALFPELATNSLLSDEGIRRFLGYFTSNLQSPFLIWLLLLSMAYGLYTGSGLSEALSRKRHGGKLAYLHNFALKVVAAEAVVFAIILTLLLALPSGPMLSVTGQVFPSSFSRSVVPLLAMAVSAFSITFGIFSRTMRKVSEMFEAMKKGLADCSPFIIYFIVVVELFYSLRFIFGF